MSSSGVRVVVVVEEPGLSRVRRGWVWGRGMGEGRRRREKGEKGGGGKEEWGKGG